MASRYNLEGTACSYKLGHICEFSGDGSVPQNGELATKLSLCQKRIEIEINILMANRYFLNEGRSFLFYHSIDFIKVMTNFGVVLSTKRKLQGSSLQPE